MMSNLLMAFGGVLFLGIIGFLIALREIRRDETRRRSNSSKD